MFAIIPAIILIGGISAGAFEQTFEDISASQSGNTTNQLSAVEIQDNNVSDMYFN